MWSWLNQYSGFLEAVAAFLQFGVALFIWRVTSRYVKLTGDLVNTTEKQALLTKNLVTVAENQLQLQANALRLDLYEKRLNLFKTVRGFLGEFGRPLEIGSTEDVTRFAYETFEARFLLEPPAQDFIEEVRVKALEHYTISRQMITPGSMHNHNELMLRKSELERWLVQDAFHLLDEHFKPYLRFGVDDLKTSEKLPTVID